MSRRAARTDRRPQARTGAAAHREWLRLVDTDGPFLAAPALARVYPQGIPALDQERRTLLSDAKRPFEGEWDRWDRSRSDEVLERYRTARDAWVETVLTEIFGWHDEVDDAPATAQAQSPDRLVVQHATHALGSQEHPVVIVHVIDPVDSLRVSLSDGWATSPIDRLEIMQRAAQVPVGVVTDGRWWAIVSVPTETGGLPASGVVDALEWVADGPVRDAIVALLSPLRLTGGTEMERLPQLFTDSVLAAEQVTDSLGAQVRRAVELLVAALSDAGREAREAGRDDPLPDPDEVYVATVTVMMRVVFLLFAEENGLLPQESLYEAGYGLAPQLDRLEAIALDRGEETLDGTHEVWHRLLATSRALYQGVSFEDLRLPAYGGSLMNPDRYSWLTERDEAGRLRIAVSDRVMRAVLDAVQVARVGGDARRVSFREIGVEQIGYIYEGLLGWTCERVPELTVVLVGTAGSEAEIPVRVLDDLAEEHGDDDATSRSIIAWAKGDQPGAKLPSAKALAKALGAGDSLEDAERALRAIAPDDAPTREHLRPWVGAIRRDLRGRLVVMRPGDLIVVETAGRKHAGAHYTPKSLAEEVVEHALAPLCSSPGPHDDVPQEEWVVRPATDLLELRVADIACGSGAFLVAAVRYLAARVVEAWQREGDRTPAAALDLRARREVVARCVYGADIDPMAVEMCKLSLWLVSLDPAKPFSFVDDKVLVGDSLLGLTTTRQVEELHIDPAARGEETLRWQMGDDGYLDTVLDVDVHVTAAMRYRSALRAAIVEGDPMRDGRAKELDLMRARAEVAPLRLAADSVIATALPLGGKPGKALNEALADLRPLVRDHVMGDGAELAQRIESGLGGRRPLHWALEVPDVMTRGGFDAIIGNPPFLGGKKLSGALGREVRDWLVHVVAHERRGSADLVAYFMLRAVQLLKEDGRFGLIATNTLAQGDTREVGLDQLVANGVTLTRAIQSRPWPARSANLEYAAVWGTKGAVLEVVPRYADDVSVRAISTLLESEGRGNRHPMRLAENAGVSFIGCFVNGMGFVLESCEASSWISVDPRNAEVLFPYLTGEDLNSRTDASPSRWVIDFYDRPEEIAATYEAPYERLSETVKGDRQRSNRKALRDRWWQYADKRPAMRKAIADLEECLVISLHSKIVMPMRVPTSSVFSHALGVFATGDYADQAVLSSSAHAMWAFMRGSTLGTEVRYTPSDVFGTFPLPVATVRLTSAGMALDSERREVMLRRDLGLTKLYNLVHDPDLADSTDPDVARLREIHVEVDEAVAQAYGWEDLALEHQFSTYRQMTRWSISPAARVEVFDRLLEENHRRAAQEGTR